MNIENALGKIKNIFSYNAWKDSALRLIIIKIFEKIQSFINIIFDYFVEKSMIFSLFRKLSNNLIYVISILIVIVFSIPDKKWTNLYLYIGVLFILFLITLSKYEIEYEKPIFDDFLILFIISIILATIFSLYFNLSLKYLINFIIIFIGFYVITKNLMKTKELEKLVFFITITVLSVSVYGIIQDKIIGVPISTIQTDLFLSQNLSGRVYSTLGNPNILGEFYLLFLPFVLSSFLYHKSIYKKIFFGLVALVSIYIFFRTGSRSAWGAFVVGAVVFVLLWNAKLFPLFFILGLTLFFFLPDSIKERMLSIFNKTDSSISTRRSIAEWSSYMKRDYSGLGGAGLGPEVFQKIIDRYKSDGNFKIAHSHSFYTQTILESGIFSLLFILFYLVKRFILAIILPSDKGSFNYYMRLASIFAVVSIMVMGIADHTWFYLRILFCFWIVLSILVYTTNEEMENKNETVEEK